MPNWKKIIAIAIGVWLALWLLGGDRSTSMELDYTATLNVQRLPASGITDPYYFRLGSWKEGAGILTIDADLPLAKYLQTQNGKTVTLHIVQSSCSGLTCK